MFAAKQFLKDKDPHWNVADVGSVENYLADMSYDRGHEDLKARVLTIEQYAKMINFQVLENSMT